MNREEIVNELNSLLRKEKLDLPSFRREVNKAGKNVRWLIDNIRKRNINYNDRIDYLLGQLIAS